MTARMTDELAASLGLDLFEQELNGVKDEAQKKEPPKQTSYAGEELKSTPVMETLDLGDELEDEADGGTGITLMPMEIEKQESAVAPTEGSDFSVDYQRVRDVTYATQELAMSMMAEAAKLAAETGNTKVFETFNSVATTVRGLNKDLMELHQTAKIVSQRENAQGGGTETPDGSNGGNVTVNIGTNSASLLRMLEEEEAKMGSDIDGNIEDAEIS